MCLAISPPGEYSLQCGEQLLLFSNYWCSYNDNFYGLIPTCHDVFDQWYFIPQPLMQKDNSLLPKAACTFNCTPQCFKWPRSFLCSGLSHFVDNSTYLCTASQEN